MPGFDEVRILIEVKYRKKTLGINDITNFVNTSKELISLMHVNGSVLVTNAQVSAEASGKIRNHSSLSILTLEQLESHLFHNTNSLQKFINSYKSRGIYTEYYPLKAYLKNSHSLETSENQEVIDVAIHAHNWTQNNDGLLIIAGDFGSGKTTIIDRIFYDCAVEKIENKDALFPVLFSLKNLLRHDNLQQYIDYCLREDNMIDDTKINFSENLNKGNLLLLLDGFDEIYTGANATDRGRYIKKLSPILKTKSPCILTTRPTFFDSMQELFEVANYSRIKKYEYQRISYKFIDANILDSLTDNESLKKWDYGDFSSVLFLANLDESQIKIYIEKRKHEILSITNYSVDNFLNYLYGIYDLRDLMERPLLLRMIIELILSGAISISSKRNVGPSTLYEIYTQSTIARDVKKDKEGIFLSPEERVLVCRLLAQKMLLDQKSSLTNPEIHECAISGIDIWYDNIIKESKNKKKASQKRISASNNKNRLINNIERVITDIRTCTFLRFNDSDDVIFAHRSFYEFFIAQFIYLANSNSEESFYLFCDIVLTKEIFYFLGSYVREDEDFRNYIKTQLNKKLEPKKKDFVTRIAFSSGVLLNERNWTNTTIISIDLRRFYAQFLSMFELSLKNVSMSDFKIAKIDCKRVLFEEVVWQRFTIDEGQISGKFKDFTCFDGFLNNLSIDLDGKKIVLENLKVNNSKCMFHDEVAFANIEFSNQTEVYFLKGSGLSGESSFEFNLSKVIFSEILRWYKPGTTHIYISTMILGCWLSSRDIVFNKIDNENNGKVYLFSCSGIIVLSCGSKEEFEYNKKCILNNNPELLVIYEMDFNVATDFSSHLEKSFIFQETGIDLEDDKYYRERIYAKLCDDVQNTTKRLKILKKDLPDKLSKFLD